MIKLPSGVEINNLIDDLRIFSWEACDTLIYYSKLIKHNGNKNNILKNDNREDPVTIADLKVNEIIIKRINQKYKKIDWQILSEENVKKGSINFDITSDWLWILDPLDGTKDFLEGTSDYAMHLALNYKQKPYIAVVLIPGKEELWITNGNNTWCEKRDRSRLKSNISITKTIKEMTIVTSKNHRNEILNNLIKKINFKNVIYMGSIGCKIASIIRGESDIYICLSLPNRSSPKDWDFAAPAAILNGAGGAITDLDSKEIKFGKKEFKQEGILIATNNNKTHKEICFQIKKLIDKYNLLPLDF